MEQRMTEFLAAQKVMSIACVDADNKPYCFSCFYAFDLEKQLFYFKTSAGSHHALLLHNNPAVAGTIQPDKLNPLAIKGIQLTGLLVEQGSSLTGNSEMMYHKKYPFALAMQGAVYTIQPDFIKMTDNTLGFGKKITWKLNELRELEHAGI